MLDGINDVKLNSSEIDLLVSGMIASLVIVTLLETIASVLGKTLPAILFFAQMFLIARRQICHR